MKKSSKNIKNKPFFDRCNWKEINAPSNKKDWNEFEKNNKTIALNILYVPHNTEKRKHVYKSKNNVKRENQVILFMITDGKKWHYLAVKSLSVLSCKITSNQKEDFHCLNYFQYIVQKIDLKKHKDVCENHDYCCTEMPKKDNKVVKIQP